MIDIDSLAWEKMNGLIPAVVTHGITGQVLMVAWCNREAVQRTLERRQVTFYSRRRQSLWTKGETSGNTLNLCSLRADCDRDTLLIEALPSGPVCHTGSPTCFDGQTPTAGVGFLGTLEQIIRERKKQSTPDESYTAQLLSKGLPKIAQKVGEEGVEVALAGVLNSDTDVLNESADLLYHLLVLLAARDLTLTDVLSCLQERHQPPRP